MDRREFQRLVLERVKAAHPRLAAELDERGGALVVRGDAQAQVIALDRYHRAYAAAAPEAREAILARIVRAPTLVGGDESLDELRVTLVPHLCVRTELVFGHADVIVMSADAAAPGGSIVPHHRPFAEYLALTVAVDRPDRVDVLVDPARYGVAAGELEEIALANLRRRTTHGLEPLHPGLYLGAWGDSSAPERMLLPELWTDLAIEGDPVVFLQERESIVVAGSEDLEALERALRAAVERLDEPTPFFPGAVVLREGRWALYDDLGPIGLASSGLVVESLEPSYDRQREVVASSLAELATPDPPFVAPVEWLAVEGDDRAATVCRWVEGTRTWLPRTHVLVLRSARGEVIAMPWRSVVELEPELFTQVPDLFPPRWEPAAFPSAATFAEWREASGERGAELARALGAPVDVAGPAVAPPARRRPLALGVALACVALLALLLFALSR